jgi:hypothetical protein
MPLARRVAVIECGGGGGGVIRIIITMDNPPPEPNPQRPSKALRWAVIAAYVLINSVVFYNARRHDPGVGYDSDAHLHYLMAMSQGRLPTDKDSGEFFSPPLPYVPGAVAMAMGKPAECAFKIAQYAQVIYSLVLTFFLLQLCGFISKDDDRLGLLALLCLGMVPAYYKTFAMIRGEPLLATLAVVIAWLAIRTFIVKPRMSMIAAIVLGLLLGAAALSRQWGVFLIPPVVLLALWRMRADQKFWPAFRTLAIAGVVCAASGSWYYLYLHHTYGSMTAFNRSRETIDRPVTFYIAFPVHNVIKNPVRPLDPSRRLLPILYSDFWGDYWLNFLVFGRNSRGRYMQGNYITRRQGVAEAKRPVEQNLETITPYLRRINAVSLFPTLVLLLGMVLGFAVAVRMALTWPEAITPTDIRNLTIAFAAAIVFFTFAGYLWFLINYTDASGDTIKASYILQTVPFLALMAANVLREWQKDSSRFAAVWIVLLIAVTAHNAPAMVTRFQRDSDDACTCKQKGVARPASAPALEE